MNATCTEVTCIDRGQTAAYMRVVHIRQVREAQTVMQRMNSAEAIASPAMASLAYPAEAAAISTPPGVIPVARTKRQPTESAPSAKANVEAPAAAPSPERDVRRRPERTISRVH